MDEQQSREGKLRDRLAKKRKAKEEEMFKAALSERVRNRPPCLKFSKKGKCADSAQLVTQFCTCHQRALKIFLPGRGRISTAGPHFRHKAYKQPLMCA